MTALRRCLAAVSAVALLVTGCAQAPVLRATAGDAQAIETLFPLRYEYACTM
jgi:hypothetical protein